MRRETERTPFGERLVAARKHAKLSQKRLGDLVGLTQSTLAEAEKTGQGSTRTAQLAAATGVSVTWLADGIGPMTLGQRNAVEEPRSSKTYGASAPIPIPNLQPSIADLVVQLGIAMDGLNLTARKGIAEMIHDVVLHPETAAETAQLIAALTARARGNTPQLKSSRFHY